MEVVGGVASIITLIEATGVLIEVSKKLVSRWQNAPHEIQALATRLSLLAGELHSIKNATSTSHPVLTDAIIRQSLSDLLTGVRKRLMKLESLHFRLEQHKPVYQRIRWTAKDASSVEKMLSKTQEVEQRLANLMILISLKAQTPILDSIERIEQMVSTLAVSLPASTHGTSATPTGLITSGSSTQTRRNIPASNYILASSSWRLNKSWETWGLRARQTTTRTACHIDRNITFTIPLSLGRIFGDYAFVGNLSIQSTPLCWGSFTLRHPSYFAVARVVDNDNPFMNACMEGDIQAVRLMLRNGEGRPTDVTRAGMTPIYFAATHNNVGVIMELLDCGTDIDAIADARLKWTALDLASESKHPDVVRLLLQLGASVVHTGISNSPTSALCWGESDDVTDHSSMDLWKLFIENELLDAQSQDLEVHESLLEASMGACKRQIHQLLNLGADPHIGMPSGTAPIHAAVLWGNHDAYSALLPYHTNIFHANEHQSSLYLLLLALAGKADLIHQSQELGPWWVDQVDQSRDHRLILLDLLQRGVDPGRRLTLPLDNFHFATDAWGTEPNAHELAARLGPETATWYLGILEEFCSQRAQQDHRGSHESTTTGRNATGFIYEYEDNPDVFEEDEDMSEISDSEEADVEESHVEDPRSDLEDDSDSDLAEHFWDANEIVH